MNLEKIPKPIPLNTKRDPQTLEEASENMSHLDLLSQVQMLLNLLERPTVRDAVVTSLLEEYFLKPGEIAEAEYEEKDVSCYYEGFSGLLQIIGNMDINYYERIDTITNFLEPKIDTIQKFTTHVTSDRYPYFEFQADYSKEKYITEIGMSLQKLKARIDSLSDNTEITSAFKEKLENIYNGGVEILKDLERFRR